MKMFHGPIFLPVRTILKLELFRSLMLQIHQPKVVHMFAGY